MSQPDTVPESDALDAVEQTFRKAARVTAWSWVALAIVALPVSWLISDEKGLWGAGIGLGLAVLFSGVTIGAMIVTTRMSPQASLGIILGSWFVKMLIIIIALSVLASHDFYDRYVLVAVLVLGVVASGWADFKAVQNARIPNIEVDLPASDEPS